MRNARKIMTPEESAEYDSLVFDATHFEDGTKRPAHEVAPRFQALLMDAVQAQREWAQWILDDAVLDGLRARGRKWCKEREVVTATVGVRTVTKPDAMSIRRKNKDGAVEHQPTLWPDMTADDLKQVILSSAKLVVANQDNIAIARRLLNLCEKTGIEPVSEALRSIGMTMDTFLNQEVAA